MGDKQLEHLPTVLNVHVHVDIRRHKQLFSLVWEGTGCMCGGGGRGGGRGDGGVWALAEGRSSAGGGVTTEERDKKKGKHNREISKGMQGYRGYEWLATALRSLTAKGPGNSRGEQEELGRQQQSGISSILCLLGEAPALTFC